MRRLVKRPIKFGWIRIKMTRSLDTNCLLRWLIKDNLEQFQIVDKLLVNSPTRLHVADLVIAEMVWVLKNFYEQSDPAIISLVRLVIEHRNIASNRAIFEDVVVGFATSPKVSFVDTYLAYYAGHGKMRLYTFDKTLAKKFPKLVELAV